MHPFLSASVLFLFAVPALAATQCAATSGATRIALLELYTSEGCSSCPPADQWLSSFPKRNIPARAVVPLAFHVDYWDKLGWIDPFAQAVFTQRQRERNSRLGWVYTPQFMLDGKDYRPANGSLQTARPPSPPAVSLKLNLDRSNAHQWTTQVEASLLTPLDRPQVYVAIYENNLVSPINAGENARRTLHHDFVVRQLLGPFPLVNKAWQKNLVFTLRPDWKASDMGIAAFVQLADGEAIQALALPACL